ncbi:hypothetical protein ACWDUM_02475 [Rhodococcus sp. NPDC003322]
MPLPRVSARVLAGLFAPAIVACSIALPPQAGADDVSQYLNLPMPNRTFDRGPGGVNPQLPTGVGALAALVDAARSSGRPPSSYAGLLLQYRLAQATTDAGIDLAGWDPARGFPVNRSNMIRSYRYYEDFQLAHRELQWAGMGGQVGADFGGGIADIDLVSDIYSLPGLQQMASTVINQAVAVAGPQVVDRLPQGLRDLANSAGRITPTDLRWFTEQVVVMQKAIFADLMPMHYAYTHDGLAGIDEFHDAGLIPEDVREAWYAIASGEPDRVADGNMSLLRREQRDVVGAKWDEVRAYGAGVGSALTYVMTLAGSPSVAGVPPLRSHRSIEVETTLPDGRTATLHTPLPGWDWSVYDQRWQYVSTELLPRYRNMVENDWPALERILRTPYDVQFETGRATSRIPAILADVAAATYVTIG